MADKVFVTVGVDGRNVPSGGEQGQYLVKASSEDYDFTWESPGSGGGGSAGTPSITKSPKDTANGALGALTSYARGDHAHPLNIPVAGVPEMDGIATISKDDSDYYAAFDHVHPHDTYSTGFIPAGNIILTENLHIFDSVDDLPAAGTAGRIVFVKVS